MINNFLILLFAHSAFASTWIVEQQPLIFPPTFQVLSSEQKGSGVRNLTSIVPAFDFKDERGNVLATSQARVLAWALIVDVLDEKKESLGRIEEELWKLYGWPEYKIYNGIGELIAIAMMDPFKIEFRVYDPKDSDHLYAKITRPLITVTGDRWTVEITKDRVDHRLLVLLPMYQTNRDLKLF